MMSSKLGEVGIKYLKIRILYEDLFYIEGLLNRLPLKFIELYEVDKGEKRLTFKKGDAVFHIYDESNELYTIINDYELIDLVKVLLIELKENINKYIDNKVISDIEELNAEIEIRLPLNLIDLINLNYFENTKKYLTNVNVNEMSLVIDGKIKEIKIKNITLNDFFNLHQTRLHYISRDDTRISSVVRRRIINTVQNKLSEESKTFFKEKKYKIYNIGIKAETLHDANAMIKYLIEKSKEYDIETIKNELNQQIIILKNDLIDLLRPLLERHPRSTQERIISDLGLID